MRVLFLLVMLAGAGVGLIYPWAVTNFSGREIGTWRVYERGTGFRPVTVSLDAADAPVRVLVDLTALRAEVLSPQKTLLTLTAAAGGKTRLATTLSFSESQPRQFSPQQPERMYRDEAGVLNDTAGGDYVFTVGPGDSDEIQMKSVDLVLRADAGGYDDRAPPIGYSLLAVGFIGFVLALRRGRGGGGRPQNPNSQPPPPRWGRNGAQK